MSEKEKIITELEKQVQEARIPRRTGRAIEFDSIKTIINRMNLPVGDFLMAVEWAAYSYVGLPVEDIVDA